MCLSLATRLKKSTLSFVNASVTLTVSSFKTNLSGGGKKSEIIFISPTGSAPHKPAATLQSNYHMFATVRYAFKNLVMYFGFFLAAFLVSLSTPRSLILQYIPNTYTSGGVPSYMGAAILAAVAVAIAYVVGTLGSSLV